MRIILVCNAAMSTGILKMCMEKELERRALEGSVEAVPLTEMDHYLETADIIFLGPQIRFLIEDIKRKAPEKIVDVISQKDFGTMNAKIILENAMSKIYKE